MQSDQLHSKGAGIVQRSFCSKLTKTKNKQLILLDFSENKVHKLSQIHGMCMIALKDVCPFSTGLLQ